MRKQYDNLGANHKTHSFFDFFVDLPDIITNSS